MGLTSTGGLLFGVVTLCRTVTRRFVSFSSAIIYVIPGSLFLPQHRGLNLAALMSQASLLPLNDSSALFKLWV